MIMINSPTCDVTAGLNGLRNKSVEEIAEIVKRAKEAKEAQLGDTDNFKEKQNLNVLKAFAENQAHCFSICKQNLYNRFEEDLQKYQNVSAQNNSTFNERKKKELEKFYQDMEQQLCFRACSMRCRHILQGREEEEGVRISGNGENKKQHLPS
ncbi:conserved Plasmodium protein, unknown function [Plasmodium knowlesi strain H]|uniref:Uncharacterized protein n=3 Tax=Plasmodium knowlesi TaxID=5850 RepID=A0A5K1UC09_PLAKH|nr:conserved Plasmodium protein, unknown function [Plasmodium knowlesi strain H]OTN65444.1 Uncharacterized protein PKNOH_S110102800 [Plasmodium knowlesi]CAA9989647.1 conserved Plasmodium protein, unknown function [Plasmodium knowlesi strain H]SBO22754.1 conserved Plasmodium protein, unknown function [Plasmodium knowlesi strain H]SBO23147.1 conserved Plasmodium protein, unknown function [Plasmodium knowlesi strain H]VVS79121.1 conserved Plasmodium protein, unknown function [Plasmodium knowlesi |eukprot:XP_002260371.1 hypothetical protein, conserved in Plasmodium species [Plasmodium knowlesi strain H]